MAGKAADDVVIVGAARTPFGKLLGGLASLPATELGSHAIRGALRQAGVDGGAVDAVILGQVLQAGAGQNPAKQAALGEHAGQQDVVGIFNHRFENEVAGRLAHLA